MRSIQLLVVLLVIAAGVVYMKYGTVEPCGILREKLRRQAVAEGGNFGGFLATVTPDSVINGMISAQYNRPVTPELCIGILIGSERPPGAGRPQSNTGGGGGLSQ
jgi:hypothetical protein